jgi:hypothetical protein
MATRIIPGPFEAGLRALLVLEALHPRSASETELSLYDHVVVNTADFGGPASLHPARAGRTGEVAAREGLIREGLAMMRALLLVEALETPEGPRHQASEDAPSFLDALGAGYTRSTLEYAGWVAERYRDTSQAEIQSIVEELKACPFVHWEPIPDGEDAASRRAQVTRFRELDADYLTDLMRLSAIAEAATLACAMQISHCRDTDRSVPEPFLFAEELAAIEAGAESEALKVRRDRAGLAGLIRDLEA